MRSKDRATYSEGDENGGHQAAAAARLQAEKAEILARWQLKVRTALAAAGPSETPLLSHRIPGILESLEGQLAREPSLAAVPPQIDSLIRDSEGPLPRVILEYRLLREAIFDVVERGGPVEAREREAILTVLERAIQEAVAESARLERKGQHWTEEQYRLLVDNARDFAIFMLDVDGHIVSWNPGAEQITRYRLEEIIGEHVSILYTEADIRAGTPANDLRTAREQGKAEVDRWYRTRDCTPFWASDIMTALTDSSGTLCGYSRLMRDDTARKQLEQEVIQRAKQLEEAHRRKDEFLAMLAHELRNPLSPIRTSVHTMKHHITADPVLQRATDVIDRQVEQLNHLLDDLLNVTRVIHGKIRLEREDTDLAELVKQTTEDYRRELQAAHLTLRLNLPEDPVPIHGDPARLRQVITNLLVNAAKFTPAGGEIMIDITRDEKHAEMLVRDTGIGIDSDVLPHIFDAFTQGGQDLDRGPGGLGLGLALVDGLVKLHGGTVTAHSEGPGQGSAFRVSLPLGRSIREKAPPAPRESCADSLRVVVIDDNQDNVASLRDLLELFGHTVAAAFSGQEGLKLARQFQPDVILSDIGLPGMTGLEVAAALKKDSAAGTPYLIALSGYGSQSDQERSKSAGFHLHLTKPVDPDELRTILADFAGQRRRLALAG